MQVQPEGVAARGPSWLDGLDFGVRFGATYMGFVVLCRVAVRLLERAGLRTWSAALLDRPAQHLRVEPEDVGPVGGVTVFLLVLAFTHWFLQPPRAAEMGRLYVGTLSLLCSILLTVMVTIMTPLSIPTDIQQQTIYTVVSKPVRRHRADLGADDRLHGDRDRSGARLRRDQSFLLVAHRGWDARGDRAIGGQGQERKPSRPTTSSCSRRPTRFVPRMQARVPIKGSLSFIDSRGNPHAVGIDVGSGSIDERAAKPH